MTNPYLDLLQSRAQAITSQISALQGELDDLRIAERVHVRLVSPATNMATEPIAGPPIKRGTVRSFVVEFLKTSQSPWAAPQEIHEGAGKLKGSEIPTGTIYPTISEMVRDKILTREGGKIALSERITNNEAPTGEPKEAS